MDDEKNREKVFDKMMQQIHLNQSITLSKNESELLVKWYDDCQKVNSMSDPIKPDHYHPEDDSGIHCHHAQLAQMGAEYMVGYHWGNIIKYVWRWQRKNGVEDLRKAAEHIRMLIELEEKKDG